MKTRKRKTSPRNFQRVQVAELRQERRGKHHDTVVPIVAEIESLADGDAIVIPVATVGIPLAKLRSALVKASAARGLRIATYSDENSLYVWRRTTSSRAYERAPRRTTK